MDIKTFFNDLENGNRWDVAVAINRSNALPLDANSIFESYEEAENYAKGTPANGRLNNAYPGQIIAVVSEDETVQAYIIGTNGQLEEVGGKLPLAIGEHESAIEMSSASALSANTLATGANTTAGGKGYKIIEIFTDRKTEVDGKEVSVRGYDLAFKDRAEAIEHFNLLSGNVEGYPTYYSAIGKNAVYHAGNISYVCWPYEKDGIWRIQINVGQKDTLISDLNTINQGTEIKQDDETNFNRYNFFIIEGRPELGTVEVAWNSFSTGANSVAQNVNSFAAGKGTSAIGKNSTALGEKTIAGHDALAQGLRSQALGSSSVAFGTDTVVKGSNSIGAGNHLEVNNSYEAAFGKYNKSEEGTIFSIGNGKEDVPANAFEVKQDGNAYIQGKVYVGGTGSGQNNAKEVATINDVTNLKNELLNGAGKEYDTLKELGELIDENTTALDALREVATDKANKDHEHTDLYYTKTEVDKKVSTADSGAVNQSTKDYIQACVDEVLGLFISPNFDAGVVTNSQPSLVLDAGQVKNNPILQSFDAGKIIK